jgi:hypothetical protein
MILEGAAVLGLLGASIFDALFTWGRLKRFGVDIELNGIVSRLFLTHGLTGIMVATVVPTLVLALLFAWFQLQFPLGILVGIRALLLYFQVLSRRLEAAIASQLTKDLQIRAKGAPN